METVMTDSPNDARKAILVIGATGGTGRRIVAEALRRGHPVTGQRRLGASRRPRRAAEAAVARDHIEVGEGQQIHRLPPMSQSERS